MPILSVTVPVHCRLLFPSSLLGIGPDIPEGCIAVLDCNLHLPLDRSFERIDALAS